MQNLQHDLIGLLRQQRPDFFANDRLITDRVAEAAYRYDAGLLALLLGHSGLRSQFFQPVGEAQVFKLPEFETFLHNRELLKSSYTAYRDRIGLRVARGRYLRESNDVVLAWPYKDCVLEGGQDKDDQKRDEVFYNETLAPDEITRLLAPKALTRFTRYDADGPHPLPADAEIDLAKENLLLKGNNLLALHSLLPRFRGQVKLIYIDPPYNTGTDSFKYNDKFNHSSWLTFMRNRLTIARDLMMDKGIIFMHIGDQEMHYLKLVADEVFGRDYFVGTVPRKTRGGKADVPWKLSQDFDWMLVYTKRAAKSEDLFQKEGSRRYYTSDDFPGKEWRLADLTTQRTTEERPNSDFTLINPRNGDQYPVNPNRCWSVSKDTVQDHFDRHKIVFPGDYDFLNTSNPQMRVFKDEDIAKKGADFDKASVTTDFANKTIEDFLKNTTNSKGNEEIIRLFGSKVASYPKNELLLERIIEYATKPGELVLDFFVGSGTTAAVAHKMGRRYIAIEQMDYINTVTAPRLQKVMAGEQGGISKAQNWTGGGNLLYCELVEDNAGYLSRVEAAPDTAALLALHAEMARHEFLRIEVENWDDAEFAALPLPEQKRVLLDCLDKNRLYVNLSEMEDVDHRLSALDVALNRTFYGLSATAE